MLLEIKNVFKKVTEPSGEVITISHADNLTLDAGGQMLLTGPSGSGKTTLLHMIAGLLSPSGGEIYFNGERSPAAAKFILTGSALTTCRSVSAICGVRAI